MAIFSLICFILLTLLLAFSFKLLIDASNCSVLILISASRLAISCLIFWSWTSIFISCSVIQESEQATNVPRSRLVFLDIF